MQMRHKWDIKCLMSRSQSFSFTGYRYTSQITHRMSLSQGTAIRHKSHYECLFHRVRLSLYVANHTQNVSFTGYDYTSQITHRMSLLQGTAIRHKSHNECLFYRVRLQVTNHTQNVSFKGYGYTSQITHRISLLQGTAIPVSYTHLTLPTICSV